jgi:hypothetical protein
MQTRLSPPQGEFNPGEPVAAVFAWVSDSLRDPGCTYELVLPSRKPLVVTGQAVREVPELLPAATLNFRCGRAGLLAAGPWGCLWAGLDEAAGQQRSQIHGVGKCAWAAVYFRTPLHNLMSLVTTLMRGSTKELLSWALPPAWHAPQHKVAGSPACASPHCILGCLAALGADGQASRPRTCRPPLRCEMTFLEQPRLQSGRGSRHLHRAPQAPSSLVCECLFTRSGPDLACDLCTVGLLMQPCCWQYSSLGP